MGNRLWTEEELAHFVPDFRTKDVAEKTGRSLQAVNRKAAKLNLRSKRYDEETATLVAEQNRERFALLQLRPAHCRDLEYASAQWYEACQRAFCDAMDAAGYLPSVAKPEPYTPTVRRLRLPNHMIPSWSQLGDGTAW